MPRRPPVDRAAAGVPYLGFAGKLLEVAAARRTAHLLGHVPHLGGGNKPREVLKPPDWLREVENQMR